MNNSRLSVSLVCEISPCTTMQILLVSSPHLWIRFASRVSLKISPMHHDDFVVVIFGLDNDLPWLVFATFLWPTRCVQLRAKINVNSVNTSGYFVQEIK